MIDAVSQLDSFFTNKKTIQFGKYGEKLAKGYVVQKFLFDDENISDEKYANIWVNLWARQQGLTGEVGESINLEFYFFCSASAFLGWSNVLVRKVWDTGVPTTVGIDVKTRKVYLVYLQESKLLFDFFGEVTEDQFTALHTSLIESEPYTYGIDLAALYSYVDGSEGLNYLRNNIYIEFNCLVGFKIHKGVDV